MSTQVVFDAEVQRQAALDDWPGITTRNQHVFHQGASEVPRAAAPGGRAPSTTAAKRDAIHRRVRGPGDRPVVLGLGTISMRKGVDLFVACAPGGAPGARPRPRPLRLDRRRAEAASRRHLLRLARRPGEARRSRQDGRVPRPRRRSRRAPMRPPTSCCSPSRLDPFPNVAMDAALAGVPVICFERANGFAEFLAEDEVTRALAVPYLDVAAAAAAILDLLHDPARRASVGARACKDRAARDFSMARYIERLQPVIADAQGHHGAGAARRRLPARRRDLLGLPLVDPHEPTSREEAIRLPCAQGGVGTGGEPILPAAGAGLRAADLCRAPSGAEGLAVREPAGALGAGRQARGPLVASASSIPPPATPAEPAGRHARGTAPPPALSRTRRRHPGAPGGERGDRPTSSSPRRPRTRRPICAAASRAYDRGAGRGRGPARTGVATSAPC